MNALLGRVAILIPARKGSRRVKGKNLKSLAGKPLLLYTIDAALKTRVTNIVLSTNYLPSELGFKMPDGIQWLSRPYEYSDNNATYDMYIRHFLSHYDKADVIVLLQPTCPLRTADDIDRALEMYLKSKKHTLISAYKLKNKQKLYRHDCSSIFGSELPREDQGLYYRNSAIYIFSRKHFYKYNSIFSKTPVIYEMPQYLSVDIDEHQDFVYAERMIRYIRMGGNEIDSISQYY